jgi:hypothetical protein
MTGRRPWITSSGVTFQILPETERRAGDHRVRNNLRQAAAKVRRFKDVFEDAANIDPGPFVGVETERAVAKVKRANVVETEDVIGVTVRDQHRIEMLQTSAQRLLPKISGSVDDDRLPGVLDQNRDTQNACRADRPTCRFRSCTQSKERPWMCRCRGRLIS